MDIIFKTILTVYENVINKLSNNSEIYFIVLITIITSIIIGGYFYLTKHSSYINFLSARVVDKFMGYGSGIGCFINKGTESESYSTTSSTDIYYLEIEIKNHISILPVDLECYHQIDVDDIIIINKNKIYKNNLNNYICDYNVDI